jgi:basic membrane protein A
MSKRFSLLLAVVLIASLILTACQPGGPGSKAGGAKICQVTDTGGIDDKSFNATVWKGAQRAQTELDFEAKYLESQQQTDYEKNLNAFLEEGCELIVTVGFLLGDATKVAAEANPDQKFAIVDFAYDPIIPNVLALTFDTDQAAFLAGYVAAATTKTGAVGTFGGLPIPTVTIFMDGFYYGVQYYNEQNGASVKVLGWDPATQEGLFTNNFESTDDGRTMGETLMSEGADIIMPVAGPVGLGTAEAVQAAGNAWIIGVDTDWTVSASQYKDIVLTSVLKNMDVAVLDAAKAVSEDKFEGGFYVGTLENDGVGIATPASAAPAEAVSALEKIEADLISGAIKIGQ